MEPALPLELVDYDTTVDTTGDISNFTAEEYLSWVRNQASQLPNYVRAEVPAKSNSTKAKAPVVRLLHVEEILPCSPEFFPNDEWVAEILHGFSQLRETIAALSERPETRERKFTVPQMKDEQAWKIFCFGEVVDSEGHKDTSDVSIGGVHDRIEIAKDGELTEAEMKLTKKRKRLAQSLGIDLSSSEALLSGNEGGISSNEDSDSDQSMVMTGVGEEWTGDRNVSPTTSLLLQFDQVLTQKLLVFHVNWLDKSEVSTSRGQWLYGLLARLEKPVYQGTAAVIRQLYRRCCCLRHALTVDNSTFDTDLATLNTLISITGSYFGQGEDFDKFNMKFLVGDRRADEYEDDEMDELDEEKGEDESTGEIVSDPEDNIETVVEVFKDNSVQEITKKAEVRQKVQSNNNNSHGSGTSSNSQGGKSFADLLAGFANKSEKNSTAISFDKYETEDVL